MDSDLLNELEELKSQGVAESKVFSEVPAPLKKWLYDSTYLGLSPLSEEQYSAVLHGVQIYKDKEKEVLGEEKVRQVDELVIQWGKGCHLGTEKISLMDGREVSFEELHNQYQNGDPFWVYSYDPNRGVVPGLAYSPRITKYVTRLIEIELDSGQKIKATPEHLYMLRDGNYKEIQHLQPGDSLMPLYRKVNEKRKRTWSKKREQKVLNHKVVSVKVITLDNLVPVYDLTVDKYHNFALSSGVFVHNSGKDFISAIITTTVIYRLICLKNPQTYYNQSKVSHIDLLNMAYSSGQAEETYFAYLGSLIKGCKWFSGKYKSSGANKLLFSKNIRAFSGNSYEESFEGKNLFVCILDEIGAFKTDEEILSMSTKKMRAPRWSASAVYDMAATSIASRFGDRGKLISISFPRYKGDFIQQLYEKRKDDPAAFVSFGATWEVNPTVTKESLANEYRRNPERSKAKYECLPSGTLDSYFRKPELIDECFPTAETEEELGLTDELFPRFVESFVSKHNFHCSMHIDVGWKRDALGVACSHVEEVRTEEGSDGTVELPVVKVDFVTSFIAPVNGEIDFELVRGFVAEAIRRGFNVQMISLDGYNSIYFLQTFQKMGVETKLRSVDRNTAAYDDLKELLYDKRISGRVGRRTVSVNALTKRREILKEELKNLVLMFDRKVQHRDIYGKDEADALAGSVQGALELGYMKLDLEEDIKVGKNREVLTKEEINNKSNNILQADREFLGMGDEREISW